MVSRDDNELLCRVGPGRPMGKREPGEPRLDVLYFRSGTRAASSPSPKAGLASVLVEQHCAPEPRTE